MESLTSKDKDGIRTTGSARYKSETLTPETKRTSPSKIPTIKLKESKDPLTKYMTKYLTSSELGRLSQTSKFFKSVSIPELKTRKAKIYRRAIGEFIRFLPLSNEEYEQLTSKEKMIGETNLAMLVDYLANFDEEMELVNALIKIYKRVTKQTLPLDWIVD